MASEIPVKFGISAVWDDARKTFSDVNRGLEKLGDSVKGYGREQREQTRYARLFAAELQAITGSASGTTRALSNLGAAFLGGLTIQTGLDLLKGGVELWRAIADEEKKAAEEAKKYTDHLLSELPKSLAALRSVQGQLTDARTGDKLGSFDAETVNRTRELRAELAKVTEEANKWRDAEFAGNEGQRQAFNLTKAAALAAELQAKATLRAYQALRADQRFLLSAPPTTAAPKTGSASATRLPGGATFGPGSDAGEAEWRAWQRQEAERKAALDKQRRDELQTFMENVKMESDAVLSELERQEAAMRKMAATAQSAGEVIGSALAQSFASGSEGAIGFGKVVLDQVLLAVQAKAVEAAATSAASVPFPANVALAAASFAFVRGMIAQIPARAEGGPVYAGQPYLVGERGPELFTPGSSGGITPNHKLGGQSLTIVATDAKSLARQLEDVDSRLSRAVRSSMRRPRV